MKHVCFVVWAVCGVAWSSWAQTRTIDSLLQLLPTVVDEQRVDLENKLATAYATWSAREAERHARAALEQSFELAYKPGVAQAFKTLGIISYTKGEHRLALEYNFKALRLFESLGDLAGQAKVLNNFSIVFIAEHNPERAFEYAQRSLRLKRALGDSIGVANSLLALADFYRSRGQYDRALRYCDTAYVRQRAAGRTIGMSYACFHQGEIYQDQQDYPKAAASYHQSIRYARETGGTFELIPIYRNLGKLYMQTAQYDSAYRCFHQALYYARQKDNRVSVVELNELLSDYFQQRQFPDSALYYMRIAAHAERDMFQRQKDEALQTLQQVYDLETKDQELAFQKKIVKRQYVAIVGVSIILALSVMFGFRVYHLNKVNRQAKESLLQLNAQVQKINETLEISVQERTEEIKHQNEKLIEYAFFTAHEIRGPLARILGLIELAKIKELNDEDKQQVMTRLEDEANELDEIIRTINRKLERART